MSEQDVIRKDIVKFMRGQYRLNEEAGMHYDIPCIRFRQGQKSITTLLLYEDHYGFLIVLGKAEREQFENEKETFPTAIQQLYEQTRTYHDGKWLQVSIDSLEMWEAVKRLILMKKKPNRKPFPASSAVCGKCGQRCDLCVHFTGTAEEVREMMIPHLDAVYGKGDWTMRCTGCATPGCQCYKEEYGLCDPLQCLPEKGLDDCRKCECYPCEKSSVGYQQLEHRSLLADDITWGILPYVPDQYEK